MALQLSREQGITLRGSAEIVAEFFCKSRAGRRAGGPRPGLAAGTGWGVRSGPDASLLPRGGIGQGGCGRLLRTRPQSVVEKELQRGLGLPRRSPCP